jgi:hypothetical protein
MKMTRGKACDSGEAVPCADTQANATGSGRPRGEDGFLDKVTHNSDIVKCLGQLPAIDGRTCVRPGHDVYADSGAHPGRLEPRLPCGPECTQIGNHAQDLSRGTNVSMFFKFGRAELPVDKARPAPRSQPSRWPPANSRTRPDVETPHPVRLIAGLFPGAPDEGCLSSRLQDSLDLGLAIRRGTSPCQPRQQASTAGYQPQ